MILRNTLLLVFFALVLPRAVAFDNNFILGGANGSGKSTLANVLLKKYSVEFLNADEIAKEYSEEGSLETVQRLAGREYIKRKC